jgi:peptide/nickel transport system ATP-binding protein
VERLEKTYQVRDANTKRKQKFQAVNNVSLEIEQGKTLAIVGESGSGKSTIARLILRLEEPDSGMISFRGRNMATIRGRELKKLRSHVQPVFQDPYSSLNPMASIGELLEEPLKVHGIGNKQSRKRTALDLLGQVSLDAGLYNRFISELSGGQRQRIAIARALALEPELMICDEPVSALDVLVQAQILQLLKRLQSERELSYLFISHDLAVVRMVAHDVVVMQHGTVVERASAEQLFENPQEEYTKNLLASIPGREIFAA